MATLAPPQGRQVIASPDCIYCSIRRLSCTRSRPSCSTCVGQGVGGCSYDWTLGPHIYRLFPGMDLNDAFRVDTTTPLHSTTTARVYRAEWAGRGLVAVKALWESAVPNRVLQLTVRESWTWARLRHHNIVPLLGIADLSRLSPGASRQLCMISQWMTHGNVMDYLEAHPQTYRLPLLWDIVKGVMYLHSLTPQIIHGDLKGNNILVDMMNDRPRARLVDFGLSYALVEFAGHSPADSTSTGYKGNPRWLAFERVDPANFGALDARDAHSTQSDVFEMMRTFLEIVTNQVPFCDQTNEAQIISLVLQGTNPTQPDNMRHGVNKHLWLLMERCWATQRQMRPPLSEIFKLVETPLIAEALLDLDHIPFKGRAVRLVQRLALAVLPPEDGNTDGTPATRQQALFLLAGLSTHFQGEDRARLGTLVSECLSPTNLLRYLASLPRPKLYDLREVARLTCYGAAFPSNSAHFRSQAELLEQGILDHSPLLNALLLRAVEETDLENDEEAFVALAFLKFAYCNWNKQTGFHGRIPDPTDLRTSYWCGKHRDDHRLPRHFFPHAADEQIAVYPRLLQEYRNATKGVIIIPPDTPESPEGDVHPELPAEERDPPRLAPYSRASSRLTTPPPSSPEASPPKPIPTPLPPPKVAPTRRAGPTRSSRRGRR